MQSTTKFDLTENKQIYFKSITLNENAYTMVISTVTLTSYSDVALNKRTESQVFVILKFVICACMFK